tara:strand:+ start:1073 stop:1324 length:252 start_codon:yes stop_codon:yes gene_type:complete
MKLFELTTEQFVTFTKTPLLHYYWVALHGEDFCCVVIRSEDDNLFDWRVPGQLFGEGFTLNGAVSPYDRENMDLPTYLINLKE